MYTKPHLSYEQQLELLKSRGLSCTDDDRALSLLRSVGYYRLSAYVYPFRTMLPEGVERSSSVHYRASQIREAVDFDQIERLWRFDRKLRLVCLDAVETIEIGMRTRVAHVLGRRDPFGHLDRMSLDGDACAKKRGSGGDAFQEWEAKYRKLLDDSMREDYVVHHLTKHADDPRLPIWIAVEFFDLGALGRLFVLLDRQDQNEIARSVGISGGGLLGAWLKSINYLRNVCAHHARLWNRSLTYKARKFNAEQVDAELKHAATSEPRDKVYALLAITAYLVTHLDPVARWPESSLRTHVRKFPTECGLSPEQDMGFPPGWDQLPLWKPGPS